MKALKVPGWDVVPELLGYQEGQQGEDCIIPCSYITFVIWDKVPGVPLSADAFWALDLKSRQAIRERFREDFQ